MEKETINILKELESYYIGPIGVIIVIGIVILLLWYVNWGRK